MKLFPNAHATHPQWRMAAALVLAQLQAQMAQPQYARKPSLGLLYITDHYVADAVALLRYLGQQLPSVADWSGTVGVGVAGNKPSGVCVCAAGSRHSPSHVTISRSGLTVRRRRKKHRIWQSMGRLSPTMPVFWKTNSAKG